MIAILALLLVAAWRDVAIRIIPDAIALLLLAAGALARILDGPSAIAISMGTAVLLFVMLLIAHSHGWLGGGDAKLMAALAVGLSPLDCYRFVIATAIAGGLLSIVYLMLPHWLGTTHKTGRRSILNRVGAIECWRIRRRASLPYGVAIAAGGAFVLLRSGRF